MEFLDQYVVQRPASDFESCTHFTGFCASAVSVSIAGEDGKVNLYYTENYSFTRPIKVMRPLNKDGTLGEEVRVSCGIMKYTGDDLDVILEGADHHVVAWIPKESDWTKPEK